MSQQTQKAFYTLANTVNPSYQMLVSGIVTDELTGSSPIGVLMIRGDREGLIAKIAGNGFFCLVGESWRLFPQLATQGTSITLSITVPGYKPYLYTLSIAPQSTFPLPTLDIKLQRVPVRIQGYVVEPTPTLSKPVPYARIRCTSASDGTNTTTAIATLRTPLHYAHQVDTPVQLCQLTPDSSSGQLVVGIKGGSSLLVLNKDMALAAGDVLLIGTATTGDYGIVAQYQRTSALSSVVQLTNTLHYSVAAGTDVQRCTPVISAMQTTLARAAAPGDGLLYLTNPLYPASPSDTTAIDALELVDAETAHREFHALDALSDENGYYRLDGIGGAQTVFMQASTAEITPHSETVQWMIDYRQPTNNVDFRLLR